VNDACAFSTATSASTPNYFNLDLTLGLRGFKLNFRALCDSGADKNILPFNLLPPALAKLIKPVNMTFNGCGSMKSVGTINGRLTHAATSHKFDLVTFYIVDTSFPPIIGRDFLPCHPDLART
jgi:hypothetical protein